MPVTCLLPVDASPASARAAALLAGYRGDASRLEAVILNVQSPPALFSPEAALGLRAIEAALLESGRAVADAAAQRLGKAGLQARPIVRLGPPAAVIASEAEASHAELIVMGTRGHGAVHGFALGSVAMRVAHAGSVPVCLVQPEAKLPADFGRKLRVLLAMDGSEPALRAAHRLVAWRNWLGELDVQLAYVQQPLTYLETVLPPHDDVIGQWSTRAGEEAVHAARALFEKENIRHHLHLTVGDAAAEIAHLAAQTHCEALALGTRGRGAAHHALIGSVALKAAARSEVPVMLFK